MTTQPSASEWNMLCSLARTVAEQAANAGESCAAFHGYGLSARRLYRANAEGTYIELRLTQDGLLIDQNHAWIH
jgi:hypothetical protein